MIAEKKAPKKAKKSVPVRPDKSVEMAAKKAMRSGEKIEWTTDRWTVRLVPDNS